MSEKQETAQPRMQLPKMISMKEDAYYSNCTMVETSPFDISMLFGKIRPNTDAQGKNQLVEVYERQIYLSHLQARALFEALGRSLQSLNRPAEEKAEPAKTQ
jgi:hypothetical protein